MECSVKEMNELRCLIVPVSMATLLNSSASQRIPCAEALLWVKKLVYFHLMAQDEYITEAMIKYMENYLEEFHCHKDAVNLLYTCKSTMLVSETLK